ncbi:MAG: Crp/Fnr family transcriptional regulator [Eubacteriales bacterium]|nr:Crp/Fnr family transcriptional regulator [Eubacteriales bacterium]MDD4583358.1 Crp/Fnr family transcriptional regulator [Eubacteriales bacterium]
MYDLIAKTPLFKGISINDIPSMLNCLGSQKLTYEKDSFIFLAEESRPKVGIMLCGKAQIIKENYFGDRTIIGSLESGDIFGETYACMGLSEIPVSVLATENSQALLLDMHKITHTCQSACTFHHQVITNLLKILAKKNTLLNAKMSYITHKTIRGRLEAYFNDQAEKTHSLEFKVPFNRNELADYLCIDRSAMCRELSRMKQEGLIDYHKNRFRVNWA